MLSDFINALKSSREFITSFVMIVISVPVTFSFIYSKIAQKNQYRLMISYLFKLLTDLVLFSIFFMFYSSSQKSIIENLGLYLVVVLIYSLSLIFTNSQETKEQLLKGKKKGDFTNLLDEIALEHRVEVLSILVSCAVMFLSIFIIGNALFIPFEVSFFTGILICSLTSAFLYPSILKLSEKVIK